MLNIKFALAVLAISCAFIIQGCNENTSEDSSSDSTTAQSSDAYASVNDVVISKQEFENFAQAKRASHVSFRPTLGSRRLTTGASLISFRRS